MNCPICENSGCKPKIDVYDDRYGYPGVFPLLECTSCGHVFLNKAFTPEQLTDLYSNYYPRSELRLDQHKPHKEEQGFSAWLEGKKSSAYRWVPKGVRILDIGCGFGQSLGYHKARGCDVYGVEADSNIQRVADEFGYKVRVGLFDASHYEEGFFDYVTMDQVLEHTTHPVDTLKGVAKVLKHSGMAVLTVPNANGWGARFFGDKWINWHAPYHLQFFSKKSMQLAADAAGFRIENIKTVTASPWLYYQWLHLFTCPAEGEPSPFWAGAACGKRPEYDKKTKRGYYYSALFHRMKVSHWITRFFDAAGMGDSRVFILSKA